MTLKSVLFQTTLGRSKAAPALQTTLHRDGLIFKVELQHYK
jgi:hypothetical protein